MKTQKVIAKTRKGHVIEITPVFDLNKNNVQYQARYGDNVMALSNTDLQDINGHFCLCLDHIDMHDLLGIKVQKYKVVEIVIETEGAKELIREIWPEEHRRTKGIFAAGKK